MDYAGKYGGVNGVLQMTAVLVRHPNIYGHSRKAKKDRQ
jgi:hypothetical protein